MLGFVIVRHVNSNVTNEYWKIAYTSIRKYYDNQILIVDDNSNSEFLKEDIPIVNCTTVKSEFPGKGELLGYYYFHKTHFVEKAVIIHDSVFINSKIDFNNYGDARTIWSFRHYWDEDNKIINLIKYLNHADEVIKFYLNKNAWHGSFGVMNVITWNLLDNIVNKYDIFNKLFPNILCRDDRSWTERIFPCLCQLLYPEYKLPAIISDIHDYGWGLTFDKYKTGCSSHLPIIKVWTGR